LFWRWRIFAFVPFLSLWHFSSFNIFMSFLTTLRLSAALAVIFFFFTQGRRPLFCYVLSLQGHPTLANNRPDDSESLRFFLLLSLQPVAHRNFNVPDFFQGTLDVSFLFYTLLVYIV
jgi:hypothetical protein